MKKYLALVAVIAVLSAAFLWQSRDFAVVAGSLHLSSSDPCKLSDLGQQRILSCAYDTLFRPGNLPGELKAGLATAYSVSEDGLLWEFQLRPNVYFHNGEMLTGETASRALNRLFVKDNYGRLQPSQAYPAAYAYLCGTGSVVSISGSGSKLSITLNRPIADLGEILAQPGLSLALEDSGNCCGTGPYRLVECRAGRAVFERFEKNASILGYKRLVFIDVPDSSVRRNELASGKVDAALELSDRDADLLRDKFSVYREGGIASLYLAVNCSKRPFSNIRNRIALQIALSKDKLVSEWFSEAMPADWLLPAGEQKICDKSKAKRLWERSGADDKLIKLVYCRNAASSGNIDNLSKYLASELCQSGLKVVPAGLDYDDFWRCLGLGEYDMAVILEEQPRSVPDIMFRLPLVRQKGINIAHYSEDRLVRVLNMARTVTDRAMRRDYYHKACEMLAQDAVRAPLAEAVQYGASRKNAGYWQTNRLGCFEFSAFDPDFSSADNKFSDNSELEVFYDILETDASDK